TSYRPLALLTSNTFCSIHSIPNPLVSPNTWAYIRPITVILRISAMTGTAALRHILRRSPRTIRGEEEEAARLLGPEHTQYTPQIGWGYTELEDSRENQSTITADLKELPNSADRLKREGSRFNWIKAFAKKIRSGPRHECAPINGRHNHRRGQGTGCC
ncbi:hypothetical protein F5Y09DRAFT_356110, partial [Xylaria sp. FL1042]